LISWTGQTAVLKPKPAGPDDETGGTAPNPHDFVDGAARGVKVLWPARSIDWIIRLLWIWSVNTSPFPAPPPNNGLAPTLEEAKQQFKQHYLEMKAQGVRPFA
jgi:hypothetical protein